MFDCVLFVNTSTIQLDLFKFSGLDNGADKVCKCLWPKHLRKFQKRHSLKMLG